MNVVTSLHEGNAEVHGSLSSSCDGDVCQSKVSLAPDNVSHHPSPGSIILESPIHRVLILPHMDAHTSWSVITDRSPGLVTNVLQQLHQKSIQFIVLISKDVRLVLKTKLKICYKKY